jgi:hypothetical protein
MPNPCGFALIIVPSLDLVIYKMGGNNGQYDLTLTDVPQPELGSSREGSEGCNGKLLRLLFSLRATSGVSLRDRFPTGPPSVRQWKLRREFAHASANGVGRLDVLNIHQHFTDHVGDGGHFVFLHPARRHGGRAETDATGLEG